MKTEYETYRENLGVMITNCASDGEKQARKLAMSGLCPGFKLCYKTGEMRLVSTYEPTPDGYKDSGRILGGNIPYPRYNTWVANNCQDLAIL
jgi:hypothetical protein